MVLFYVVGIAGGDMRWIYWLLVLLAFAVACGLV